MSVVGEFDLIKTYFEPLAGPEGLCLKDDVALYSPKSGDQLVISKDMLTAGVHFFSHDDPFTLAQKALRVTLSDLAAKGARPKGYILGLGLPKDVQPCWLAAFAQGLAADQLNFGLALWGGDTIRSDQLTISITGFAEVTKGQMPRRDGAQQGDGLFVTGTIGNAALGLELIKQENAAHPDLIRAYHKPDPPVRAHGIIAELAHSAMDISDGLIADLAHLIQASGVGAQIELDDVPLSQAAHACIEHYPSLWLHLFGGDDYQILFTAAPKNHERLAQAFIEMDIQVTQIGHITHQSTGLVAMRSGLAYPVNQLKAQSYTHF